MLTAKKDLPAANRHVFSFVAARTGGVNRNKEAAEARDLKISRCP